MDLLNTRIIHFLLREDIYKLFRNIEDNGEIAMEFRNNSIKLHPVLVDMFFQKSDYTELEKRSLYNKIAMLKLA